jgi:hypothetical protein
LERQLLDFLYENWGKFGTGLAIIIGVIYKTGEEHHKYQALRCRVACLEEQCDRRFELINTMNQNLCRIMGKMNIQPVEGNHHRRESDKDEITIL